VVSPYCFPPCVPSRADPSGLGHAATIYSSVQGPPGVETLTSGSLTPPLTHAPRTCAHLHAHYHCPTPLCSAPTAAIIAGNTVLPFPLSHPLPLSTYSITTTLQSSTPTRL
jgi:hypothetical protein